MDLAVRRALPGELPICAAIYQRALRETFTWQPPWRHRAEDFLRWAPVEEIYVATSQARIVGVAGFFRPDAFIHSLYAVEPGRGAGKALLDHLTAVADRPLSLKCQAPNLRAQAFYRREGFRVTEEGHDPTPGGVGWLRMSR